MFLKKRSVLLLAAASVACLALFGGYRLLIYGARRNQIAFTYGFVMHLGKYVATHDLSMPSSWDQLIEWHNKRSGKATWEKRKFECHYDLAWRMNGTELFRPDVRLIQMKSDSLKSIESDCNELLRAELRGHLKAVEKRKQHADPMSGDDPDA